ncbi:MAG TPA: riboflavin synthase [Solirubrobacteraceae bacterium]|jgi:riboflavin synthase|nr:riboflavin synthase [Solirubrobacteraceae bacterium]
MFTGLIADLGSVKSIESDADGATLEISTALAGELAEGDSVAVNGVCLTVTAVDDGAFYSQAMHETLRRSSLQQLRRGSRVNLELALRADGRLGGHIVQGHVDGTGTIAGLREEGFSRVLEVDVDDGLARYLVEKGSVALDGVSLTVSELRDGGFSVSLIPETLVRTNLGEAQVGDRVNLEVDILAKHIERLMEAHV